MVVSSPSVTSADAAHKALVGLGFGPFFGTPCGVLAPLLARLADGDDYHVVSREDNALALAAGAALAGRRAVALMQNSGFGQAVNVLASLVVPYRIPLLMVVSMRGTPPDTTAENLGMGHLTTAVLDVLGVPHISLEHGEEEAQVAAAADRVISGGEPCALLVAPDQFAWVP
ncbi:thiamine pyrophosphate-binding protein [Nocardioides speluncae]|uniref:thiamine pyrophosphate-binding protein n=1 Tax=Nocardioides speluncae TaxID=2670337 RepID=UPI000D69AA5A|nr:thiamine pyrophosphate-binding protein [Nocardioides speluncae]